MVLCIVDWGFGEGGEAIVGTEKLEVTGGGMRFTD